MYIVELEEGVFIADFEGDPGRTKVIHNAKKYGSRKKAEKALSEARFYRPFLLAEIRSV